MKTIAAAIVYGSLTFTALAQSNLIVNAGFETPELVRDVTTDFGDWGVDVSQIVTAENWVTPQSGARMLKFVYTDISDSPPNFAGTGGDVAQLVDVSSLSAQISSGSAMIEASAYFNRAVSVTSDTEFQLIIRAYTFDHSLFTLTSPAAFQSFHPFFSDADPLTWEYVSNTVTLPSDTQFLLIGVSAVENLFVDDMFPEFSGHYADNVRVTAIPEASSYAAWSSALSLLTVLVIRRKQSRAWRMASENRSR